MCALPCIEWRVVVLLRRQKDEVRLEEDIGKYRPFEMLGYILWLIIAASCIPIAAFTIPLLFRLS
jgi:hypothetical protein